MVPAPTFTLDVDYMVNMAAIVEFSIRNGSMRPEQGTQMLHDTVDSIMQAGMQPKDEDKFD